MKRNSKRFLALFLSVAMTVTPAVLTQAENEDANVQVSVTPTPETEAEKTVVAAETPVQENVTTEEENTETTATPAAGDASAVEETPAVTEAPASETTPAVTASPAEESKNEEAEAPQPTAAPEPTATPQPTATPEPTATPQPTAAPTQAPSQNEITDAGIKLEKENGDEFAMFVITGSTVKVSEDKYIVTLSTAKQNYDMIYLGSASDSDKEANSIKGVENSAGGYTYTFEVTASKEAQTIAVVPHSKKSQNWYAKGILTITVPAVPGYGEAAPTPEPTVSPEPTEAPVETPAPTETPVPSTPPEATTTPEPTATPAPGSCASGIYNITVNSSSSMFRVIDCVLTSKNGKMTAVLTLSGTGYDYLCLGTKEEAAAADSSTWVPYVADANGIYI